MRSRIVRNYVIWILLYTLVYISGIVIMDKFFDGVLLEFLFDNLRYASFWFMNSNRLVLIVLIYVLGLLIISICYVFRLGHLLNIASRSIAKDEPFKKFCPAELVEFSRKLNEFKYELKVNEQARQRAEQQKNDLVVYLAHDLKTPLTSVIGYLSLLEETPELPIEQRIKYTGIALDKAYRLEQLINEFFDITRMNLQDISTQKSHVNVTIMLVQIISEFFPAMEEKGITVKQEIDSELVICADADKLARMFENLFRNAINYSHTDTEIVCGAKKYEGYVQIMIKNRGEYIPPEKMQHLFEKFYRVDSARQSSTGGAGLGLAIVKQIVELHDGTIEATCNDGEMEFRIELPV